MVEASALVSQSTRLKMLRSDLTCQRRKLDPSQIKKYYEFIAPSGLSTGEGSIEALLTPSPKGVSNAQVTASRST